MNTQEQQAMMARINAALAVDDMEAVISLAQQLPMPPEVADALRVGFGAEALKTSGFNLSEANKRFGADWLD